MELKREYQNGLLPWYSLHWAREKRVFVKEKIVLPYRSKKNIFSLSEENFFGSKDILYIQNKLEISRYSYKYLLSLFNSKLYYYWLWYKGKRKGDTLELYVTPISNLPVKNVSEQDQQPFIEKVEKIIELKKQNKDTTELENEIDEMVYDLYELTEEEKEIVRNFKS
jgi:adenine-specific DNA-methyltransferase